MKLSEITIAEALQANGYKTACVGKWHCAINHNAFPQPKDQGLDVQKRLEGRLNIRRIQQEFAESQPKTEWVDTDDLNDRKADDKVIHDLHYHQEGYRILGERFAKKSIGLIQQPSNQTSKKSP